MPVDNLRSRCQARVAKSPRESTAPPGAFPGRRIAAALAAVLLLFLLAGPQVQAEGHGSDGPKSLEQQVEEQLARLPSGEEGVDQILGELDARLTLSTEQAADVREVVTKGVAAFGKLRDRFKAGELTAMAFGVQVQMQMQKIGMLVEPLLDPDQQAEYKVMRQEQRRQMMQAMQKRRAGAAATN